VHCLVLEKEVVVQDVQIEVSSRNGGPFVQWTWLALCWRSQLPHAHLDQAQAAAELSKAESWTSPAHCLELVLDQARQDRQSQHPGLGDLHAIRSPPSRW